MQRDENENRQKAISIHKKINLASSLTRSNQHVSLYEKAFQLTGDTSFSRKLEEEELKEEERRLALQERKMESSASLLSSSLCVPIILAVTKHGFAATIQETVSKSVNLLFLAWLPALFFTATWIEIFSVALLLVRPAMRSFVLGVVAKDTLAIAKKLLLSELWRHFWKRTTTAIPIPILSPSTKYLDLTPFWFRPFWTRAVEVVDKYVHGLLRKSFQESLGIVVGAVFESFFKLGCYPSGLEHHEVSMVPSSAQTVQIEIGSSLLSEENS